MKQALTLLLALGVSLANADTTVNVLSSTPWTGATTGTLPANRMPGSATLYDSASGTVNFSYTQGNASKTIAINNALAGSGIQVNGYNYTYDARNMNGDDRQSGVDTLTVTTKMTSNTGSTLLSSSTTHNTKFEWTTFSGTQTANTPYALSALGNLNINFSGKDGGFWSGYFGPEVRNVGMSLNYTVDPCMTNPAYSTSCANYNTVQSSNNLVPNPTAYAQNGYSIDQTYAINQALGQAGAGATIHGFDWGYVANANGPYCNSINFLGCWGDIITPSVTTNVNITSNTGASLYNVSRTYTNSYNTTNYRYLFPTSRNISTLGNFNFTASTNDTAYIGSMWSNALYTPDPCSVDPLSSTNCAGYQQAFHDQQCSANPLYAVDCPGYQTAYLTQQCNANPLYSPSCPGYTVAYHDQQCRASPLYMSDCPGYQEAYLTQQCSISPLYSSQCTGYAVAYHDQQCSLNALYMSDCTGYAVAYKSQQCSISSLYATDCPGYAVAYKNQQCSLSPLYASDCPGYAVAYHDAQCSANPLYMVDCPGYQAAYLTQQCNISQLYSTSCPNYQQAYFTQQCQLSGLYDRACPNYGAAYAAKNILATPAVTSVTTSTVVIATESTATVTSNPAAVAISDPVVSAAVSTPSTTSATSPTSVTSVISTPAAATSPAAVAATTPMPTPAPSAEAKAETKKTEGAVAKAASRGNVAAAASAAATAAANATSMEAQTAAQGLVVGLMGYVPGFSAYQNAIVPDALGAAVARQYHKPNVDNRNAQRRLNGASDAKWQEMVDSQYKMGDK